MLYPSFVAGMVGYHIASRLGVRYFHQALYQLPHPTEGIFLKTIAAGTVFDLGAPPLIEMLRLRPLDHAAATSPAGPR